jgi:threonylcarbamoyladenosine tRNA methylthiotransferase MtaB
MKIFLDTIGCRLNQAEIESLALQFRKAGHEIVASAKDADLAVINTCSVTSEAASDSRAAVRRASRLGTDQVVVTGCWATLEPDKAAALPGVYKIFPNQRKEQLVADLLDLPQEFFDLEPLARYPLPGLHARTRAFIKAQDGCDNACTFCITTVARGASQSRPMRQVLTDVRSALDGGANEIVLTGVHLGSWGLDLPVQQHLGDLVTFLLAHTSIPRLRLSSLEPWDLDEDFFSLWQDRRMCRHLHLPLQSGSRTVLKRMARKTTPRSFSALVRSARNAVPELAITTDVIVGFPGETEAEFSETLEFIKSMKFAGGHVFSYSARPGTPAARMRAQVDHAIRKERSAVLHSLFADTARVYRQQFIGQKMPVLWESAIQVNDLGWRLEGLTDNYIRIKADAPEPRWNRLDVVELTADETDGLRGVLQDQHHKEHIGGPL